MQIVKKKINDMIDHQFVYLVASCSSRIIFCNRKFILLLHNYLLNIKLFNNHS